MPAQRHYSYRFQVHDNTKVKLLLPYDEDKGIVLYASATEAGFSFLQVQLFIAQ